MAQRKQRGFTEEDDRQLASFMLKLQNQMEMNKQRQQLSQMRNVQEQQNRLSLQKNLGVGQFAPEQGEKFFGFLDDLTSIAINLFPILTT